MSAVLTASAVLLSGWLLVAHALLSQICFAALVPGIGKQ